MLDQLGFDVKYLLGALGLILTAVVKYLHKRIIELENLLRTTEEKVEANGKAENDKVWDALDRQRAALDSVKEYVFKENATKNDLNAMERRIMSAIEKAGR